MSFLLKKPIPVDKIKEFFSYNPDTGIITWKKSTCTYDRTGMEAGYLKTNGYKIVNFFQRDISLQKIAFILMTGYEPDGLIFFNDGDRSNLKWSNLRLVRSIRGYDHKDPAQRRSYLKAYRAANPKKEKERTLRSDFDIGIREYEAMIVAQNGKCAICNQIETTKRRGKDVALSVDHCHETGAIRGLLCNNCNNGLGQFKDNAQNLLNAVAYLAKHKEAQTTTNVLAFKKENNHVCY